MAIVQLKIKRLPHCRELPRRATPGSAGLDLTAAIEHPLIIDPGKRLPMPTGLIVEIPDGFEGQIRPRSGLASKFGISLANCVGTIDSDYRGELIVLLINHGDLPVTFEPGERIAQLIISAIPTIEVIEVDNLTDNSDRGAGGFGSTGRS